jgi:hypothetical protein
VRVFYSGLHSGNAAFCAQGTHAAGRLTAKATERTNRKNARRTISPDVFSIEQGTSLVCFYEFSCVIQEAIHTSLQILLSYFSFKKSERQRNASLWNPYIRRSSFQQKVKFFCLTFLLRKVRKKSKI